MIEPWKLEVQSSFRVSMTVSPQELMGEGLSIRMI